MNTVLRILILGLLSVHFVACEVAEEATEPDWNSGGKKVDWKLVSEEHNPLIEQVEVELTPEEKRLFIDLGDRDVDLHLRYTEKLEADQARVEVYWVTDDEHALKPTSIQRGEEAVSLVGPGIYKCQMKVEDNKITQLTGGCIVEIQVYLPKFSLIEVYQKGRLSSERFHIFHGKQLVSELRNAEGTSSKFQIIDDFILFGDRYRQMPEIRSSEMASVLRHFDYIEYRLDVLRRLHPYVTDRYNLDKVIKEEFSPDDRDSAREIAGL